jgi:hypothetical protein
MDIYIDITNYSEFRRAVNTYCPSYFTYESSLAALHQTITKLPKNLPLFFTAWSLCWQEAKFKVIEQRAGKRDKPMYVKVQFLGLR